MKWDLNNIFSFIVTISPEKMISKSEKKTMSDIYPSTLYVGFFEGWD